MSSPEIPRFLTDLYGDLRDRRLLPLVAALAVAIPAVPVMLKTDAPEPVAPVAVSASAEEDVPSAPAVLAAQPGLRDYRERLEGRTAKSPFGQDAAPSTGSTSDLGEVDSVGEAFEKAAAEAVASAEDEGAAIAATGSSDGSASAVESDVASESAVEVPSSSGGGSNGSGARSELVPLAFRVDVRVGHAGDTSRRRDVKLLTSLPSQSRPVAMFLGASEDGKSAVFLISEDVTGTHGEGTCLPSAAECEFLTLKPGEERRFDYGPDGERFVLELIDVHLAEVEAGGKADSKSRSKKSATRQSLSAGLRG